MVLNKYSLIKSPSIDLN